MASQAQDRPQQHPKGTLSKKNRAEAGASNARGDFQFELQKNNFGPARPRTGHQHVQKKPPEHNNEQGLEHSRPEVVFNRDVKSKAFARHVKDTP